MNSFWKGFFSLFDWMFPRSLEEQMDDLDSKMQDLYDRWGWGKYNNCSGYTTAVDINRILEAENEFNNVVDDYIYWSKRSVTTHKDYNSPIRDPARPRTSKYYDRQQFK